MNQLSLFTSTWNVVIRPTLDFFVPPTCVLCHRITSTVPLCHRCAPPKPELALSRCDACFRELASTSLACAHCAELGALFRRERFLWTYSPVLRSIIHRMKYGPSLLLAEWLGHKMADHFTLLALDADWTHVVPLAGTPERLALRGFDQAEVLAKIFCARLGLGPSVLRPRMLRRDFRSKAQAVTAHRRRFANSAHGLSLREKPWPGARILLIDDVTTTGATAQQAAILLRNAGASKVDLLSLVRSDAWEEYRLTRLQRVPKHLLKRAAR